VIKVKAETMGEEMECTQCGCTIKPYDVVYACIKLTKNKMMLLTEPICAGCNARINNPHEIGGIYGQAQ